MTEAPPLNVTQMLSHLKYLDTQVLQQQTQFEGIFYFVAGVFVFMMQLGFALLEAGTVRSKNVKSVLLKNTLDLCIASFCWYFVGYSLSGNNSAHTRRHETPEFFHTGSDYNPENTNTVQFVVAYGFLATATTIVSGSVLARMNLYVYLCSSFVMSIFVYPLGAFWMWNSNGWLHQLGAIDNAGGAVVHICGGSAALVATVMAGPRVGRFMKVNDQWIGKNFATTHVSLSFGNVQFFLFPVFTISSVFFLPLLSFFFVPGQIVPLIHTILCCN